LEIVRASIIQFLDEKHK